MAYKDMFTVLVVDSRITSRSTSKSSSRRSLGASLLVHEGPARVAGGRVRLFTYVIKE